MLFEWGDIKRKSNLLKHGVDVDLVQEMDWGSALRLQDEPQSYGEHRYLALAFYEEETETFKLAMSAN